MRNIANALPVLNENRPAPGFPAAASGSGGLDEFSIPSPWARFILFETALINPGLGELHTKVRAEWRGLLALVALSRLRGLNLGFRAIEASYPPGDFQTVLNQTKPANSLYPADQNWDKLYAITLDETVLLGMLSNSTLVCTPCEYDFSERNLLQRRISWFRGGSFVDPVRYLDADFASALSYWLQELGRQIRDGGTQGMIDARTNPEPWLKLLAEFGDDLETHLRGLRQGRSPEHAYCLENHERTAGSVRELLELRIDRVEETTSDLALAASPNFIIVNRQMWNIASHSDQAERIHVFGNIPLRDLPENFVSGSGFFGQHRIPPSLQIYLARDLFLPDLYLIPMDESRGDPESYFSDQGETFGRAPEHPYSSVLHYAGRNHSVIWPVNEVLLRHVAPEDIRAGIRLRVVAGNRIEVSMRLKVTGPPAMRPAGQNSVDLTIQRYYTAREDDQSADAADCGRIHTEISYQDLSNIAVWPYMTVSHRVEDETTTNLWTKYYTFIAQERGSLLAMEPKYGAGQTREYRLNRTRSNIACRYVHSNRLPQYISCSLTGNESSRQPAGVVFLRPPQTVWLNERQKWTIGLDFGTTSTTAFYNDGLHQEFIRFGPVFERTSDGLNRDSAMVEDSVYLVTQRKQDEAFNSLVYQYFLPYSYLHRKYYLSMYEHLRDRSVNEVHDFNQAFSDGHIFFHNNKFRLDPSRDNIAKDLKWGGPTEKEVAREYLKQLMLQCAQRAASSGASQIEWRFSYPTAFSPGSYESLKMSYEKTVEELASETGLKMDIGLISSESIAASMFFQSRPGNSRPLPNEAFVCVDIGGGSTDVSIWQLTGSGSNKLQTSFKLASRDIFLSSLHKSPKVFDTVVERSIRNDDALLASTIHSRGELKSFLPQVEYALSECEPTIAAQLPNIQTTDYYKDFARLVATGFLGILYYLTLLIEHLFETRSLPDVRMVRIYLSGNGARLYRWLVPVIISQSQLEAALAERLKPLGINQVSLRYQEDSLKTEAALGLLALDQNNNEMRNQVLLAGEDFLTTGGKAESTRHAWGSDLQGELMKAFTASELNIVPAPELKNLQAFIGFFNKLAEESELKLPITPSQVSSSTLAGKIQQKLMDLRHSERLDPLFILGILSLLEVLGDEPKVS